MALRHTHRHAHAHAHVGATYLHLIQLSVNISPLHLQLVAHIMAKGNSSCLPNMRVLIQVMAATTLPVIA